MTAASAKRPTLVKQQTRASKAKQDESMDAGMSITLDGVKYTLRMGDLTALDARALRRETGYSFPQLMMLVASDASDIDLLAAAIWFARYVGGEKSLTYEDVAAETGYDVIDRIEVGEPDEGELGPEA